MQHLQKNGGYLLQAKYFSLCSRFRDLRNSNVQRSNLPICRRSLSPIFRTLFQVPYPASPLFVTLTKTPGVWGYSSHFGTPCAQSNGQLSKRGEMGTGARGAPVPEVGLQVKIKRAQSRRPGSRANQGRVNFP